MSSMLLIRKDFDTQGLGIQRGVTAHINQDGLQVKIWEKGDPPGVENVKVSAMKRA